MKFIITLSSAALVFISTTAYPHNFHYTSPSEEKQTIPGSSSNSNIPKNNLPSPTESQKPAKDIEWKIQQKYQLKHKEKIDPLTGEKLMESNSIEF